MIALAAISAASSSRRVRLVVRVLVAGRILVALGGAWMRAIAIESPRSTPSWSVRYRLDIGPARQDDIASTGLVSCDSRCLATASADAEISDKSGWILADGRRPCIS